MRVCIYDCMYVFHVCMYVHGNPSQRKRKTIQAYVHVQMKARNAWQEYTCKKGKKLEKFETEADK